MCKRVRFRARVQHFTEPLLCWVQKLAPRGQHHKEFPVLKGCDGVASRGRCSVP